MVKESSSLIYNTLMATLPKMEEEAAGHPHDSEVTRPTSSGGPQAASLSTATANTGIVCSSPVCATREKLVREFYEQRLASQVSLQLIFFLL